MTPSQLLADTYAYFKDHGFWPLVRTLQATYGPRISVRALAAEVGSDKLLCNEGADGRCILTLQGLRGLPDSAADLDRLAAAVAFLAKRYEASGSEQVDHVAIGNALGLTGLDLARVGGLLSLSGRYWSGGSWRPDNTQFSITPAEEAFFFRDVASFAEFEQVRTEIERNDRRIGEVRSNAYRRAHGQAASSPSDELPTRYQLFDPDLDLLFQRDLAELSQLQTLGAWKATAVIAGACLETLLMDVCKRREQECKEEWQGRWPRQVNASDLVKFAHTRNWITQDHAQLASVVRRWRNLVHPHHALQSNQPTKELSDALVGVLRLLTADLSRRDAV